MIVQGSFSPVLHKNEHVCCRYSLEVLYQGASDVYQQHIIQGELEKIIPALSSSFWQTENLRWILFHFFILFFFSSHKKLGLVLHLNLKMQITTAADDFLE